MLKTQSDILKSVRRRFDESLSTVCAREAGAPYDEGETERDLWPLRVALGRPRADELARDMRQVATYVSELRAWSARARFEVTWSARRVGGIQEIPTHVVVRDLDGAARMLGADARRRLAMTRARAEEVTQAFPDVTHKVLTKVLSATRTWEDVDLTLLMSASRWFATHDATGLTPRQVPLAGFHAKWLNARDRRSLIGMLTGRPDLGLVEAPASVAFAYLDPAQRSSGGRRFDLYIPGDVVMPPYEIEVALIVENKDTYRYFPAFPHAVCVFGAGYAGAAHVRTLPWIDAVKHLVYWGDMDADGLVILNEYRAQGLAVSSMLMDLVSYERYERFGTSQAASKQALEQRVRRDLPFLTEDERALYELLLDPAHTGHRRIEQERIPLDDARDALSDLLARS